MPIFKMNIDGYLPTVGLSEADLHNHLAAVAEMARGEWVRQAQVNLGSISADYIAGIQPVEINGNWASVSLVGNLPNMVENGKAPFDMKPGLLAGPNAKMGKSGRFNTVPFRHGTPGSSGKRVGQPMPYTHTTKKGALASFVYTDAKKLKASSEGPTGKTVWGGRTGDFGGYGIKTQPAVAGGRPGAYTWKSSPYAAMSKVSKTYKKATQNQYFTFRRVSDNSDPSAWWHPGFIAQRFVNKVASYVEQQLKGLL